MKFKIQADYKPTADQDNAISSLVTNYQEGVKNQVLLGVTGSGKTFTAANVIQKLQLPALVISHNKTLSAQLYQEFKSFFPKNAVSYFVSYYDYYQPEAYIPSTDTYIEKDSDINETIDKLRLEATSNLLSKNDTIVVASVSSIYNLGSPSSYKNKVIQLKEGDSINREELIDKLINLQYQRGDFGFHRGTFRVIGENIDIYPAYEDIGIRLSLDFEKITNIKKIDPLTGAQKESSKLEFLFPAKHFVADVNQSEAFDQIRAELSIWEKELLKKGKNLEAHRIRQKVDYDLEMISDVGYVKGIENYSRYFDGRKKGEAPFTLLDYFTHAYGKDWLIFIDESHITFPQIRGMHAGDRSRKQTLIEYGFRLPSALDNRPLTFDEFLEKSPNLLAISATPSAWEVEEAQKAYKKVFPKSSKNKGVVEQLLRPTGIPDPEVAIRPTDTQVADVIKEIKKRADLHERVLVTTLTKKTAEDLSEFLVADGIKAHYLHSDVKTLERTDILDDLRRGNYDCLIGVNLLREGLDLPEVSLVAILDADKEGFLRSEVSLVQTMGRAARHVSGTVILYADKITGSINRATAEVKRRRAYQLAMNKKLGIVPSSISKPLRDKLTEEEQLDFTEKLGQGNIYKAILPDIDTRSLTPMDRKTLIKKLESEMLLAARELNFEFAAEIRDRIKDLQKGN